MATLAADFPGWHIWRSRSMSGRETGWNATRKGRFPRLAGSLPMLAAADAAALRSALAQQRGTETGRRGMSADPGAGQTQGALTPWERDALEAVRFGWDTAYLIGYDDERGYWAARRDRIGGLLTAPTPDELRQAITEDYALKPVPREPAARGGRSGGKAVLGADPGALLTGSAEP